MTDQSPNDQFHASSFMQGHNAAYLEQMYARYANDPGAVDEAWQAELWGADDEADHDRQHQRQRGEHRSSGGLGHRQPQLGNSRRDHSDLRGDGLG